MYGSVQLRLPELNHPITLGIGGMDAPWRPEEFTKLNLQILLAALAGLLVVLSLPNMFCLSPPPPFFVRLIALTLAVPNKQIRARGCRGSACSPQASWLPPASWVMALGPAPLLK